MKSIHLDHTSFNGNMPRLPIPSTNHSTNRNHNENNGWVERSQGCVSSKNKRIQGKTRNKKKKKEKKAQVWAAFQLQFVIR